MVRQTVKIAQKRGTIRCTKDQLATLRGLGLNKINRERVLEDTPAVRGMIDKVKHMIVVKA